MPLAPSATQAVAPAPRCAPLRLPQTVGAGAALVAGVALVVSGCQRGPAPCEVTGTITHQGKPLTSGLINFLAEGRQPQGGAIQSDGSYRFALLPGSYQVRVDTPPKLPAGWKEGDPPPRLGPRQAPVAYSNYATSGLVLEVTGDENPQRADFELR